jgi:hypothetical protein
MKAQRILIMELPGACNTYFAEKLKQYLEDYGDLVKLAPNKVNLGSIPNDNTFKIHVDWFNTD